MYIYSINIKKVSIIIFSIMLFSLIFSFTVKANDSLNDMFDNPIKYNTEYYVYHLANDFRALDMYLYTNWNYPVVPDASNITRVNNDGLVEPGITIKLIPQDGSTEQSEILLNTPIRIMNTTVTHPGFDYWNVSDEGWVYLNTFNLSRRFFLDTNSLGGITIRPQNMDGEVSVRSNSTPHYLGIYSQGEGFRFVEKEKLTITDVYNDLASQIFVDWMGFDGGDESKFVVTSRLGDNQTIEIYAVNEFGIQTLVETHSNVSSQDEIPFQHVYGASGYIIRASNSDSTITAIQLVNILYDNHF